MNKSKKTTKNNSRTRNRKPHSNKEVNSKFDGSKSVTTEEDVRGGSNDPNWYSVSTQMLSDAGRIPFNRPLGYPIKWGTQHGGSSNLRSVDVPGIMTLDLCTGPGYSDNAKSAVNLAARNIYTFVRHVNSGASNYDSPDLIAYILTLDSCYQLYSHLIRAYGIAMSYTQSNRYTPAGYLHALGFDPEDIQDNMPRFRFIINRFVRKVGSRPVPANLNILKRHSWLYANLFKDAQSKKAQVYAYTPAGFHFYNEVQDNPDAKTYMDLKYYSYADIVRDIAGHQAPSRIWSLDVIDSVCENMANRLLASEDLGIISGDIMKAYGQNIFILSEIHDDFFIEPVHDEEVLKQIHNSTVVGPYFANEAKNSMDIRQDTTLSIDGGSVVWTPMREIGDGIISDMMASNKMLDSNMNDPDPAEVMVSTRLMAYGGDKATYSGVECVPIVCGTDFVNNIRIWNLDLNGNINEAHSIANSYHNLGSTTIARIMTFDWAPITYYVSVAGSNVTALTPVGQIDNWTLVSPGNIDQLHETAILSEWDVPETAFYKA